jgi:hypothetical protein
MSCVRIALRLGVASATLGAGTPDRKLPVTSLPMGGEL